eukprot:CAMPEP_0174330044 /NCGR_PEP_ID=MMETSP0810-20121108/16363_1 /TAXON_ID=73025 ORGANISM="Eutreptiella gymnastica-like, Strain CCMP1594" /NCGR_SAMPLE_ID=MMETSP0810 /ASSEMBLY_ACC=CAM_ASM_000659 /LENGTH=36 /DNA_ID= /DNA_START= /DNA_END= /DNA_ORIENTATION=
MTCPGTRPHRAIRESGESIGIRGLSLRNLSIEAPSP